MPASPSAHTTGSIWHTLRAALTNNVAWRIVGAAVGIPSLAMLLSNRWTVMATAAVVAALVVLEAATMSLHAWPLDPDTKLRSSPSPLQLWQAARNYHLRYTAVLGAGMVIVACLKPTLMPIISVGILLERKRATKLEVGRHHLLASLTALLWVGSGLSALAAVFCLPHGYKLGWWLLGTAYLMDTCGWLGGVTLGRTPLESWLRRQANLVLHREPDENGQLPGPFVNLSNGKSFIGTICWLVGPTGIMWWAQEAYHAGRYHALLETVLPHPIGVAWLFIGAGILTVPPGDLLESAFKRRHQHKDSGRGWFGRGGGFDQVDSLLLFSPLILVVILILQGGLGITIT